MLKTSKRKDFTEPDTTHALDLLPGQAAILKGATRPNLGKAAVTPQAKDVTHSHPFTPSVHRVIGDRREA